MTQRELQMPEDGAEAMLLDPPFGPGDSPFKVKGNAYRGHMKYVAQQVPGGHDAQRDALRSMSSKHGDSWARFMDQNFVTGGWYDTYPLAIAGIACARVVGKPFLPFVRERTDWQARSDIGGLYKFLLRLVSARALASRVPNMASQYFDFVEASSTVIERNIVDGQLTGIPIELAPWWATIAEAYVAAVLELAGNLKVNMKSGPFVPAGEAQGRALCTVHTRVWLDGAFDPARPVDIDLA